MARSRSVLRPPASSSNHDRRSSAHQRPLSRPCHCCGLGVFRLGRLSADALVGRRHPRCRRLLRLPAGRRLGSLLVRRISAGAIDPRLLPRHRWPEDGDHRPARRRDRGPHRNCGRAGCRPRMAALHRHQSRQPNSAARTHHLRRSRPQHCDSRRGASGVLQVVRADRTARPAGRRAGAPPSPEPRGRAALHGPRAFLPRYQPRRFA